MSERTGNGDNSSGSACNDWKCGNSNCQQGGAKKISITFVLIGRSGSGKSSTGNSILAENVFSTSSTTKDETTTVAPDIKKMCCYNIKVVDTPGVVESNLSRTDETRNPLRRCTARDKIRFLLIGKTGSGQSSTGNSILGKRAFKSSGESESITEQVTDAWAQHGCFDIQVVDSPGLRDTKLSKSNEVESAIKNMVKALLMCNGGVHVFVLVLKLGDKFTLEMKETISDLKAIFGENYMKEHGIVVITGGDNFAATMNNDGTPDLTFEEWVNGREQSPDFKRLVKECGSRIVLFNNFTEKEEEMEEQRMKLFGLAEGLRQKGCHTSDHLNMYREIRQKLTKEKDFSVLEENIQRKINLLTEEIEGISQRPTLEDVDRVEIGIMDLLSDITNSERREQLKPLGDALLQMLETTAKLKSAFQESGSANIEWHAKVLQSLKNSLQKVRKVPWEKILKYLLAGVVVVAVTIGAIAVIVGPGGKLLLPVLTQALPVVAKALLALGSSYLQQQIENS